MTPDPRNPGTCGSNRSAGVSTGGIRPSATAAPTSSAVTDLAIENEGCGELRPPPKYAS